MSLEQKFVVASSTMFVIEVVVSAAGGRPLHRWRESLASLGLSAFTGFTSAGGKLLLAALYIPLWQATALFAWTGSPLQWLLAWLGYDFLAYWFHRWCHETNLGWAVHVVHHQSEHMNWAAAARTAPFRSFIDWPTILPLAVFGVPIEAIAVLYILHVIHQVPIHVVWLPKLGPFEWFVNTPSHHRHHHGCTDGALDVNYGAHLIVWDRLFGTFAPETGPAVYGVRQPLPGWDPFRSTFGPFAAVLQRSRRWSLADRLRVWVSRPGWTPNGVEHEPVAPRKASPRPPHLGLAVLLTTITSVLFLTAAAPALSLGLAARLGLGALGLGALRASGHLLDEPAGAAS